MKKLIYLPLLLLTLVVGVNKVNADTNVANFTGFYNGFAHDDWYTELKYIDENYQDQINHLISLYNSNFSSTYSYYYIFANKEGLGHLGTWYPVITLFVTNEPYINEVSCQTSNNVSSNCFYSFNRVGTPNNLGISWQAYDDTYIINSDGTTDLYGLSSPYNSMIYATNFDFTFSNSIQDFAQFNIPAYSNVELGIDIPSYTLYKTDILPTYKTLSDNSYNTYTEIDLNEYDYVILSLHDYSITNSIQTNIYTLGSLCFTPVYDYGMTEKKEYFPTTQVQSCTDSYTTYTPVMISLSQSDIEYHAVWYIKSQHLSDVNKIKVDTNKFNITYITSSNADDPQVEIGGRSYPVIPFDDLTDTANKSSNDGYVSGRVCALGDVNCYAETGLDINIDNIWTQPLQTLKSLWTGISNFFTLVASFISLLPSPLREFLITAFTLAILLGVIKMIL